MLLNANRPGVGEYIALASLGLVWYGDTPHAVPEQAESQVQILIDAYTVPMAREWLHARVAEEAAARAAENPALPAQYLIDAAQNLHAQIDAAKSFEALRAIEIGATWPD